MELAGGGAVCYAPSRLGKLVLRITGFPRVTHQCHQSQQQEDSHHRETRHLYLGFHHPWDRDLWKSWIKQVSQTRWYLHYYRANFLRWPCSWIFLSYIFFFYFLFFHVSYFFLSFAVNERKIGIRGREDKRKNIFFEILYIGDESIEMNYGNNCSRRPSSFIDQYSSRNILQIIYTPPKTFHFLPPVSNFPKNCYSSLFYRTAGQLSRGTEKSLEKRRFQSRNSSSSSSFSSPFHEISNFNVSMAASPRGEQ